MCLLVVLFGRDPDAPLVLAANRDERLERPATAVTVLGDRPRVLGGRDDLAGGTWLAVNEHGVVAGLTNRPVSGGRDPAKRSRGELPLAFTRAAGAAEAVARVVPTIDPDAYNPCWLLVGDRRSLFSVEIVAGSPAAVRPLGPGAYVLENRALGAASAKVDHVMAVLATVPFEPAARTAALKALLADHHAPAPRGDEEPHVVTVDPDAAPRPAELSANCVHTEGYGTRSALLVTVPADPGRRPLLEVAAAAPCQTPFTAVDELWTAPTAAVKGAGGAG